MCLVLCMQRRRHDRDSVSRDVPDFASFDHVGAGAADVGTAVTLVAVAARAACASSESVADIDVYV